MSVDHNWSGVTTPEQFGNSIYSLPKIPRSVSTLPTLSRAYAPLDLVDDTEFDALMSSSPVAQSTPRMRLEPTYKNGKKTLRSVPAESHSMLDLDSSPSSPGSPMDLDMKQFCEVTAADEITPEREIDSRTQRASKLGIQRIQDFAIKKHPSPGKSEWETLENGVAEMLRRDEIDQVLKAGQLPSSRILTSRDPNMSFADRGSKDSDISLGTRGTSGLNRVHNSMPSMGKVHRFSLGSMTYNSRRNSRFSDRHSKSGIDMENYSDMDIDELQMK